MEGAGGHEPKYKLFGERVARVRYPDGRLVYLGAAVAPTAGAGKLSVF